VFDAILRRCIRERLVGDEGFAVDASLIKADANRQKRIERDKGLPPGPSRAIDEYLPFFMMPRSVRRRRSAEVSIALRPAARWTGAHGGQVLVADSTNYLDQCRARQHGRCRGGLEHRSIDGDTRCDKQIKLAAQRDELAADFTNGLAIVLAEICDGL
jgi:hypothetical protein